MTEINASIRQTILLNSVFVGIIILVGILFAVNFNRTVAKPIEEFTGFLVEMADNDFTAKELSRPTLQENRDETGRLAKAVVLLSHTMNDVVGQIVELSDELSQKSDVLKESSNMGTSTISEINSGFSEFTLALQEQAKDVGESVDAIIRLAGFIEKNQKSSLNIQNSASAIEENQRASESILKEMTDSFNLTLKSTKVLDKTVEDL